MQPGTDALTADDPTVVGHYRLLGRLGQGGMGAVYRGVGPDGRPVAVKVIRRELATDPGFRARFADEVGNARRVASFCTARVLDHGEAGGVPYMVTEYIEGPSLGDYVSEHGPLPLEPLKALAAGIATALVAIHGARLVHRDLKPSNVLLSSTGPRVIDFGVARAVDSSSHHTQTGFIVGSPGWIAPEQVYEGTVGTAADVFTWGSLIAFAATGRHPYGSGNLMVLAAKAHQGAHDLTGVPDELVPLITRALDPDPARRPAAEDLLVALVGDDGDPQTGARRLVTSAWTPSALPPAVFHQPPPAPPGPPGPITPPPMHMTPPPFPAPAPMAPPMAAHVPPMTPPPVTPQPMPVHHRPSSGSGAAIAFLTVSVLIVLAVLGFGAYVLTSDLSEGSGGPDTPPVTVPSRSGSPGQGAANEITGVPATLCRTLAKALPAKARGVPQKKSRSDSPDMRFCAWQTLTTTRAVNLSIDVQVMEAIGDESGVQRARDDMRTNWENINDPEFHRSAQRLTGLGDEAIAAQQISPIIAGPSEDNVRNYWMGGANVYVRHRNVIIEVTWVAADYPASVRGSRVLQGRNLAYAPAKNEAIRLARTVLNELR
ncbi:serine/threonine-protein kinase [Thermomonospora amylolytica]|uniref:serine/threonine-protein kinase n=1 Tax=Thermomonospora amylolytica TaxID=1411117 RepID=UPI002D7A1E38|nr:serine/threonine-protein kinase [Thermomonospora amylolytica]